MFRAHRPIFRRVRTAVHTIIGSVSVPLCSRALFVVACLGDYSLLRVENSHQDRPQHTEHANRAAQKLNQWLCEQLCLGDYSLLRVENSHQDRPQHTQHANRAAQKLNQWLCEQLYELS